MYKILLGIRDKGTIVDKEFNEDEDIWCDFSLEYNIEEKYYYFSFETMLCFENEDGCKNWILFCFDKLTKYMNDHNYDTSKELDMYTVFTEGVDVRTHFETIEDAYAFMKLVCNGFNGQSIF